MKRNLIVILAAMMAVSGFAFSAQAGEHGQKGLELSQLPSAVQKVLKQETTKHPLESITMGDDESAKVYEAKFLDGAQTIELKLADNGRLVSREVEQNHREDREEKDD